MALQAMRGFDFAVPVGTPVYAAHDGMVQLLYSPGSYGNWLQLWGDNVMTMYAHLSETKVSSAQHVGAGTVIALSGNTGRSTGPHLHFGLCPLPRDYNNGYKGWVDPLPYLEEGERQLMEALKKATELRWNLEEIVRMQQQAQAHRLNAENELVLAKRLENQVRMKLASLVSTNNGLAYQVEALLGGGVPAGWEG